MLKKNSLPDVVDYANEKACAAVRNVPAGHERLWLFRLAWVAAVKEYEKREKHAT